jgi:hypothetical protein
MAALVTALGKNGSDITGKICSHFSIDRSISDVRCGVHLAVVEEFDLREVNATEQAFLLGLLTQPGYIGRAYHMPRRTELRSDLI